MLNKFDVHLKLILEINYILKIRKKKKRIKKHYLGDSTWRHVFDKLLLPVTMVGIVDPDLKKMIDS